MRTAWTPHALTASSLAEEAGVPGFTGRGPVTNDQFPAVMIDASMQPFAARQRDAHIAAWRRRSTPT